LDVYSAIRGLELYGKAGLYGVIVTLLALLVILGINLIYLYAVLDVAVAALMKFINRASLIYALFTLSLHIPTSNVPSGVLSEVEGFEKGC